MSGIRPEPAIDLYWYWSAVGAEAVDGALSVGVGGQAVGADGVEAGTVNLLGCLAV